MTLSRRRRRTRNRTPSVERTTGADTGFLTDPDESLAGGDLITHEFSHSWNGKYRRPDDLTTPNFQVAMRTDLLWVYEGMNQYLGDILSFRSGIREPKQYPEYLATVYASMDTESGRSTTPLIDLTTGAPLLLRRTRRLWFDSRNSGDFYAEGELLWLDVDTIIRARSHARGRWIRFCIGSLRPETTGPIVDTYTRAQVEQLLNEVEPYDGTRSLKNTCTIRWNIRPPTSSNAPAGSSCTLRITTSFFKPMTAVRSTAGIRTARRLARKARFATFVRSRQPGLPA